MADHMAEDGFKKAGYTYISIDVRSINLKIIEYCRTTLEAVPK